MNINLLVTINVNYKLDLIIQFQKRIRVIPSHPTMSHHITSYLISLSLQFSKITLYRRRKHVMEFFKSIPSFPYSSYITLHYITSHYITSPHILHPSYLQQHYFHMLMFDSLSRFLHIPQHMPIPSASASPTSSIFYT